MDALTVLMDLMKHRLSVPLFLIHRSAIRMNSSAKMVNVSQKVGSVITMMTVAIIQMNSRVVSIVPLCAHAQYTFESHFPYTGNRIIIIIISDIQSVSCCALSLSPYCLLTVQSLSTTYSGHCMHSTTALSFLSLSPSFNLHHCCCS